MHKDEMVMHKDEMEISYGYEIKPDSERPKFCTIVAPRGLSKSDVELILLAFIPELADCKPFDIVEAQHLAFDELAAADEDKKKRARLPIEGLRQSRKHKDRWSK